MDSADQRTRLGIRVGGAFEQERDGVAGARTPRALLLVPAVTGGRVQTHRLEEVLLVAAPDDVASHGALGAGDDQAGTPADVTHPDA